MAGRPTKLTPETIKKLCQAIELGATYELACKFAGISYETFNEWRKAGQEAPRQNRFSDFSDAIKHAEGNASVKWLAKIEQAANEHWQAAAWKLERRYPKEYGRTVQETEHSGETTIRIKYGDD